ncbi:MAG: hypothetical protein MSG64_09425 [Pyrinomonadaceae bacterium MAG19_C2-C3]|nr:hypothetical protein [Pyrinomonadaceae bacterium MAG19_C2-C3]
MTLPETPSPPLAESAAPDESRWHKVYLGIIVYLVMLIILLWTFSRVFSR